MINITHRMLLSPNIPLNAKLKTLNKPEYYGANNVKDFLDDRDKIKTPLRNQLNPTSKDGRNFALTMIRGIYLNPKKEDGCLLQAVDGKDKFWMFEAYDNTGTCEVLWPMNRDRTNKTYEDLQITRGENALSKKYLITIMHNLTNEYNYVFDIKDMIDPNNLGKKKRNESEYPDWELTPLFE